jgi:hypothetical protein
MKVYFSIIRIIYKSKTLVVLNKKLTKVLFILFVYIRRKNGNDA